MSIIKKKGNAMLLRILIAIGVLLILSIGGNLNYKTGKESLSDAELKNMLTVMDEALVNYYCNHSGNLPDKLDEATVKVLGLKNYDWQQFTYNKGSKNFTLNVKLSNGKLYPSVNSGKTLTKIENED